MQFIQQSPVGGRRGGDVRPHEDGVQTDALDVGPRDGQGLVPAQQPEEPGPPQQKQAPDAGRVGVQLHIVHPAMCRDRELLFQVCLRQLVLMRQAK